MTLSSKCLYWLYHEVEAGRSEGLSIEPAGENKWKDWINIFSSWAQIQQHYSTWLILPYRIHTLLLGFFFNPWDN